MTKWNTLYQHAQYWQKNNTQRDMMECVIKYTLTLHRRTTYIQGVPGGMSQNSGECSLC